VRNALTTLPWVETNSIKTDSKTLQAKFTVKSKSAFNVEELKRALGDRYGDGMTVLTGPTE
jgi:hypothetical protein